MKRLREGKCRVFYTNYGNKDGKDGKVTTYGSMEGRKSRTATTKKYMEYGIVICSAFEIDSLVKRRLRLEVASQEFEEED